MPTLYKISEDLVALHELLAESGGDVTGCEDAVDAWMAEAKENREAKVANYIGLIRELEARADATKAEADRLANRERLDRKSIAFLRDRLLRFLSEHKIKRIDTPRGYVAANVKGGALPMVMADAIDMDRVPDRFVIVTEPKRTLDRDAIRRALEQETPDPDAAKLATLGERGTYLKMG